MRQRFKPILQEQVIKERKEAATQEELRKKYGVKGQRIVQIKKEHIFTSVARIFWAIIRKTILIMLILLAFNGLVAGIHPDSRKTITYVYGDAFKQLETLFPEGLAKEESGK